MDKHSSLLFKFGNYGHKKFYNIGSRSCSTVVNHFPQHPKIKGSSLGACIIKLITAVIYGFRNKLVFVHKH
jgi:hypothetical protein